MVTTAPSSFRVIAIISTYNEEDIIVPVVNHLVDEGISVYVIDNWSTDRTWELVNELSPSLIGLERFPKDEPSTTYDWGDILKRKQELSRLLMADWFMHYDADEIRESPWPEINLKDAIYLVDRHGYNAINFQLLNFFPIDNTFIPGSNPVDHFEYYQMNEYIGNELQIKAWKRTIGEVNLLSYGGHTVEFQDRIKFPYKFIVRHYPIRSQLHGEKKVYSDRIARFNTLEKEKGWHTQYDHIGSDKNFLKDPSSLTKFDRSFYLDFFIEQLLVREEHLQNLNETKLLAQLEDAGVRLKEALLDFDRQSKSYQKDILSLENALAEKDQALSEKDQALAKKDQVLAEKDQALAEKNHALAEKIHALAEKNHALAEKDQALAEKDQEILFYALSKSWQYTRPLRKIVKYSKRLFRKKP